MLLLAPPPKLLLLPPPSKISRGSRVVWSAKGRIMLQSYYMRGLPKEGVFTVEEICGAAIMSDFIAGLLLIAIVVIVMIFIVVGPPAPPRR